jgi:hypothetical protein
VEHQLEQPSSLHQQNQKMASNSQNYKTPGSPSLEYQSAHHLQQVGDWKITKLIGQGATGRVMLAIHTTTGERVLPHSQQY